MTQRTGKAAGICVLVVTALALATFSVRVRADIGSYVITAFDFPGAAVTQAYGINARGDIVGTYQNAGPNNGNRGFLLRKGQFAPLDYPGRDTTYTIATAIGPSGDIVGYYGVAGGAPTSGHGFVLSKHGEWTAVENVVFPEPTMTPSAFRILPNGTLVGCFHYATSTGAYSSMHGFVLTARGAFSRFDYPSASGSMAMHYGATPDGGTIVGVYTVAGINHGYLLKGSELITFNVPDSVRTTPQDINADGIIVGTYRNPGESTSVLHGFVVDTHLSMNQATWEYTAPFDVPGALTTRLRGINAGGAIVGDYVGSDGRNHGFIATPHE